jgi:hypothetical protein
VGRGIRAPGSAAVAGDGRTKGKIVFHAHRSATALRLQPSPAIRQNSAVFM